MFFFVFFRIFLIVGVSKHGPAIDQKVVFLRFRENTVFDRFRWSATPTTQNRSFWGTPFWRGISTMATIHQYTRDEYMGSGQRCSKRGQKVVQKVTKNGHFWPPKMVQKWAHFGGHFGPQNGRLCRLNDLRNEVQNDTKNGPKSDPKRSLFDPFWVTFWTPYLVVHAGYVKEEALNIEVPPKGGQKGGPKVTQNVSKRVTFWTTFWTRS